MDNLENISKENKTVFIVGPTSSGKTFLAHTLAQKIGHAEIISADSMQVFKHVDILSAKPPESLRKEIKYHLVDYVGLHEEYSVARFYEDACACKKEITQRGNTAIVVGGTGLYVRTLLRGIFDAPPADEAFRKHMHDLAEQQGAGYLHSILSDCDPLAAQAIKPQNIRRVIRALEVHNSTGMPISSMQVQWEKALLNPHPIFGKMYMWGIYWPRQILYERINQRVQEMYKNGLVDEVMFLLSQGIEKNLVVSQAIGIKEIAAYLKGEVSLSDALETIQRNTRRFAKRQLTWFAKEEAFNWCVLYNTDSLFPLVEYILKAVGKY
ncbi:tRNA (adenosine(37)-N6)-dimethylallyltransferase MiaA [bacterium]|nr:tRNA (adenosine(37)-N6)-dimethylallyltransferase MiaA [bacterium]MCP5462314.1 tRNA (adenosine(37)-N6)-dimethylallyltransferase MiaA [bacterium]